MVWLNGFINSHALSQYNESSSFNDMDRDVENVDVSGGHCFMNSNTLYEANKLCSLCYIKKRDGNVLNVSGMKDTGLQNVVEIDILYFIHTSLTCQYKMK